MKELHLRKSHDYGSDEDPLGNLNAVQRLGVSPFVGVIIRLSDKFARVEQYLRSGELHVKDESIKDTLRDIGVYSQLAIVLLEREKNAVFNVLQGTDTTPLF